jgi:hypothetical protein
VAAWSDAISAVALDGYGSGGSDAPSVVSSASGAHRHGISDSGDGSGSQCEITNSTPDLRDYFLRPISFASAGSKSGNGTVDYQTAGTIAHGTHRHYDSNDDGGTGGTAYHSDFVQMAAHAQVSVSGLTWLPPYYALAFIMYGG